MARFCTKCGASIPEGNQFCTACGTPVSAAAAAPQPGPVAAQPGPAAAPAWTPVVTPNTPASTQAGWNAVATPTPAASTQPNWTPAATPTTAASTQPNWTPGATPTTPSGGQPGWNTVGASTGTPPPYAPVQQRSGGAVKVILIIVGAFIGLGILCVALVMFGLWRVSRHVHVGNNGDVSISTPQGTLSASGGDSGTVKISTPQGTLTAGGAGKVSASDLGIDIYPGATRHEGGMQISTAKGSTVSAVFSTDDPMDKVVSFYKDKMGQGISVFENEQGAILTMNSDDNKSSVVVTISADTSATDGHTKIAIMHTKGS